MIEKSLIIDILQQHKNDCTRLMDILLDLHKIQNYMDKETISVLAEELDLSRAEIEETISFYHFFSLKPRGKYNIYLTDSITANMKNRKAILEAFERECGTKINNVTPDGLLGLYTTSCIGMNDQEPAAIINDVVFTNLTPYRVKELVKGMRAGEEIKDLIYENYGDGNNADPDVESMVSNNIRKKSIVLKKDYETYTFVKSGIKKYTPTEVIKEIENSNLRGRGGAGFPTGLKWRFGSQSQGEHRVIICNADEGEPGTFKDRVLLTEYPEMVFEGMTAAAYATGSDIGVLYLRYEYTYLLKFLKRILNEMRKKNFLGKNIGGIEGFDFDIRIQLGAGAYICGEESALIESMEGKRGEPRDKPPFPVEKGYLGYPTIVNNVETLVTAVKILQNGAKWYSGFGTNDSLGTKLLSISGDCKFPGIYEVEWGTPLTEVMEMCGAEDVQAIQVGGPSGMLVSLKDLSHLNSTQLMKWYKPSGMEVAERYIDRRLSYSDLPTGGSIIIFNNQRDLLGEVVMNFMEFFIEESCGSCSTCRNMPYVMKNKLQKILDGHGVKSDIEDLLSWGKTLKASRCGLGQTAGNPILSSIFNFRHLYEKHIQSLTEYDTVFNLENSVQTYQKFVHKEPVLFHLQ
ncbi:MAG: NAD(P)H-dependent oxidoreductase subunit E [Bacteroidales bacterium]|nr:NAD(P)H-dependent oxidoreductase subunit E [Bacteroidales bacterium]